MALVGVHEFIWVFVDVYQCLSMVICLSFPLFRFSLISMLDLFAYKVVFCIDVHDLNGFHSVAWVLIDVHSRIDFRY